MMTAAAPTSDPVRERLRAAIDARASGMPAPNIEPPEGAVRQRLRQAIEARQKEKQEAAPAPAAPAAPQAARAPTLHDVPQREPNATELERFRLHPEITGMATDDGSVILNPDSPLTPEQKEAVLLNERARVYMRRGGPRPTFAISPEQRATFKDYSADEQDIRETIAARNFSGDPSGGPYLPEQTAWVQANLQAAPQAAPGKPLIRRLPGTPEYEGFVRGELEKAKRGEIPAVGKAEVYAPAPGEKTQQWLEKNLAPPLVALLQTNPLSAALLYKVILPSADKVNPGFGERVLRDAEEMRRTSATRIPKQVPVVGGIDPVELVLTLWINLQLMDVFGKGGAGPAGPGLVPPPVPATMLSTTAALASQGTHTAALFGSLVFADEMRKTGGDIDQSLKASGPAIAQGFGIGLVFGAVLNAGQIRTLIRNRAYMKAQEDTIRAAQEGDPKQFLAALQRGLKTARAAYKTQGDSAAVAASDQALSRIAEYQKASRAMDLRTEMQAWGSIKPLVPFAEPPKVAIPAPPEAAPWFRPPPARAPSMPPKAVGLPRAVTPVAKPAVVAPAIPAIPPVAVAPTPGSRADLVAQVEAMRGAGETVTPETVAAKLAVSRDVAATLIGEVAPAVTEGRELPPTPDVLAPAPAEAVPEKRTIVPEKGAVEAPAVGAEPEVAPPTKPEALPEAVEAEPTPVREPLAPTRLASKRAEAKRGPLVRAMPIAERQQLAERLELAASEAIGKDLETQELRDRFAQAVRESVPEAQQGAALAMADRIKTERSYLRALSRAEKLVMRTYGVGAEKVVSERTALRGRLRGERLAADAAWRAASAQAREKARAAKADIRAIRTDLVDAVRDALPVSERGKLIAQIRDAETPKTLAGALARVDKVVEQYGQRRARTHLVRLFKKAKKAKLRRQYKPVVASILEGYNVSSPSDSTLTNLAGMARYLAQHPEDHFLTNREVASLDKITARNIRDMTAEELDAVSDAITQILHANRTTNRLLAGQQRRRIGDAAERLRTIQKHPLKGYGPEEMTPAERRGILTRAGAWLKRTITPARFRASLADQQSRDPGQPGGPVAELVERSVTYGASDALGHAQGAADALQGAIRAEGMDPNSAEFVQQVRETPVAVRIPSSGKTVEMSIADLMSFYANTLDPENRRALVRDGWTPEYLFQRKTPKAKPVRPTRPVLRAQPIRLTAEDALAIRDALPEPYRHVVEAGQAYKNGPLRDAAWNSVQAVKGYAPESLPDQWHLRRNRAAQERRDAGELQRLWFQAALEDSGILKDRSPGARQPVITGDFFSEYSRQISIMGRVAGLTVPVRDARMFLGNPLTRSTLDAAFGPEYVRTWNTWLQNVAGAGIQRPEEITGAGRRFTGKYMGAKLAGNVIVGFKTLGSLAPATHYVGGTYIAKATAEVRAIAKGQRVLHEALERAEKHSPLIRDRYERSPRDWLTPGFETGRRVIGPSSWAEKSMLPIRTGDRTVVGTTWRGVELRIEAENPGLKESDPAAYYEKVRRFAEDVVGWTQPFAGAPFQPPIGFAARRNPVIHWVFTMFKSQPIQNVTMALDETNRFSRGPKNKAAYKRLMSAYIALALQAAWYFMWTQFARKLYKPVRRKVLGEERAEREDKIATIFNALRATVGNVVFVDPFLDGAEWVTRRQAGLYSRPLLETPIGDVMTEGMHAVAALHDAVDKAFDGEWEKSRDKTVEGTLRTARVISNVTGLPEVIPRYTKLLYDYFVKGKGRKKGPVAPTRPVPPKPPTKP